MISIPEANIEATPGKYIIYGLVDPRSHIIRYIGKSTSGLRRPQRSLSPSSSRTKTHKNNWIRSLREIGLVPDIVVLSEYDNPECLGDMEKVAISKFRADGYSLTNSTDGGEGALGRKLSQESREKIARARMGNGHPHTEAHKERMRLLYKDKKRSSETCEKIQQKAIGRVFPQEVIDKQIESRKKTYASPEWVGNSKAIIEVGSGTAYKSLSEAARILGLRQGDISNVLRGRQRTTGGFTFQYVEFS